MLNVMQTKQLKARAAYIAAEKTAADIAAAVAISAPADMPAADIAAAIQRARRLVKYGYKVNTAVYSALTADRARDQIPPTVPAAHIVKNDDNTISIRAGAIPTAAVDREKMRALTAADHAAAARIIAPLTADFPRIDFEKIPFIVFDYTTKKGAARKFIAIDDTGAGGMMLNAIMICRAANRQKMRGLSSGKQPADRTKKEQNAFNLSATIPKKMYIRDRIFSAVFGKMCAAYITADQNTINAEINRTYTAAAVDDNESYELISTALTALYSGISAGGKITADIIRAAKSAVNSYIAAETKTANNRYSAADDTTADQTIDLQSYKEWARGIAVDDTDRAAAMRRAICDIFSDMRAVDRVAVYVYGINRDTAYYRGGIGIAGGGSIARGGYTATAAALNEQIPPARRAALYNSDTEKMTRARVKSEFDFNFSMIQRAVEKFRAAFTAKYPDIVADISAPADHAADIVAALIGTAYRAPAPAANMPAARAHYYKNDLYNLFENWYV